MDIALQYLLCWQEPVAEVPLRGGAGAYGCIVLRQQVQFLSICVRGVNNRGARTEESGPGEQLDGAHPVLRLALLDLARLLVGVDVQGETVTPGVLPDLLQPPSGHRPGYGLCQGVGVPIRCSVGTVVDVMELGDARVSGGEHLFVTAAADLADGVGGQFVGQGVHPFPPRPEVVQGVGGFDPLYRTPQPALKSMAMIVDEPGSQRFSGQTLASLRGTDIHYPSVLERYADSALRPISVEDQIRDQGAPHDVRREATRPARKPPQHPPET